MTIDAPLLTTKLHAPVRRTSGVRRARLTDRLDAPGRLVLVAAPAGFGKTSILTEWLTTISARTAWLSLDERDDDGTQFWRYLLAAIENAKPELARGAAELLATGSASMEAVLATLLNDLHVDGEQLAIVLDDLHVVDNPATHDGIAFLVDNLPANVRVVIASRTDPPLPLARMRARGELVELRAADLRFTPDEISAYLNGVMGLSVADDDISKLDDRTEGWIAALQLAALSLQGRPDPGAFIAGFAGDDRYVVDYLVEEVLQRQPDAIRAFLLQTSVLRRLSSDLCTAVTLADDAASAIEALDRANLFLIPLDDHREWYRYHHLFAEMLRARLLDEQPAAVADLHLRASLWFENHGDTADAIAHAIDAGAFERAATLIKAASPAMQQQRQEVTLAGWYGMLPPDLVRADPELGIGYAGVLLSAGRTDGVEQLLRDAEDAAAGPSEGVLALRRGIALYGSAQSMSRGDLQSALEQSAHAVALSADGSDLDRGSAHGIRGLILWAVGELEQARATWAISLRALEKAGHLADVLGGSIAMGDILIALGRLDDAEVTYRRGLELGASSVPPLRGTADMHVGLADLLRERGDLPAAREHLVAAETLGEYAGLPQNRHRRRMAAARLLQAEGDPASCIPLLEEAETLYTPDFFPEVRPIASLRARLELAADRADEARRTVRRRGVAVDDELSYLSEYDHITLTRVLLAPTASMHDVEQAAALLDRVLAAAESGGRDGVVVELLMLRARAASRAGEPDAALAYLERAVARAEPERYVRVFADEGHEIAGLLAALGGGQDSPYLRRLRAAVAEERAEGLSRGAVLEALSERELEVMRLLATDLSGPDISRHLVVSLNTLRTHTKNIYAKLGVTSRREAVTRARDLGLVNSPG
jgi:LuxR family maltose regulon positive regulatory protein